MSAAPRQLAFGRPLIGEAERAAVAAVLAGPILVHGPRAGRRTAGPPHERFG